jgi:hypothetical protein
MLLGTIFLDADEAEHPAGALVVAAEGGIARVAVGTEARGEDILLADAEPEQLESISGEKIEEVLAGAPRDRTEKARGKAGASELLADVVTHLLTIGADAGAERRQNRPWVRAEAVAHPLDRFLQDSAKRPPPAAVGGGDDAPGLVDEEDGKAIRRHDDQK